MDHHIKEHFSVYSDECSKGNFHQVIALHEAPDPSWDSIAKLIPDLCRGWYELAHLKTEDRIEFLRDFWSAKLPYFPGLNEFLNRFFASLDGIGVFVTQKAFDSPFEASLIYSIKNNGGFFRGGSPITEKNLETLAQSFAEYPLPDDYIAFLHIHDGFAKATDSTGLIHSTEMLKSYENFQFLIQNRDPIKTNKGTIANPKTLIPFYKSFGMPFYQCFWAEWYPEQEMGNIYYSEESNTISEVPGSGSSSAMMAFSSFTDWLMFYLERID